MTSRRDVVVAGHRGDLGGARLGLTSADPKVRASAIAALDRAGALPDDDLRSAFGDPHPAVRRRAAELAATRPALSLLALLADPDSSVVEMAAFACGEQGRVDTGVVDRLAVLATDHTDPLVREAAVASLGAIGDPSGLPAIIRATHDKAAIRRRAVIALTPFDGPGVDEALARAGGDRDWQVRQLAEDLGDADQPS